MVNFIPYLTKHFSYKVIIWKNLSGKVLHEQYNIDWEIFCSQGNNRNYFLKFSLRMKFKNIKLKQKLQSAIRTHSRFPALYTRNNHLI